MKRNKGSVFILALGVVAVLIGVLASVVATQRNLARQITVESDQIEARLAALAGLERARQGLEEVATAISANGGATTGDTATTGTAVTSTDSWATLGNRGDERFIVGDASFRLQILDSCSFIDINSASEDQLLTLPLTQEQVESLLDFRESSAFPRALGAKDEYYNALPNAFGAKLARFDAVDELLHVRGFTAATLYEEIEGSGGNQVVPGVNGGPVILYDLLTACAFSPNIRPDGESRLNVNAQGTSAQALQQPPISLPANVATQIVFRRNWAGLGDILALPGAQAPNVQASILDNLTTSGSTRVPGLMNINTASESALSSIPGITPDVVQAILQRQPQGITALSEITSIPGLQGTVLQQAANVLTVNSLSFTIRVVGEKAGRKYSLQARIEIRDGRPIVTGLEIPPFSDMTERWYWQTEPTTETVLSEGRT
jgi:DNA uptake protein ComE-like DNA-binding protein